MKDFLHTLSKPDWDGDPKRSGVLHAANLLQIGEFQLIQYVEVEESASFYPPYIEKRVVYPEFYKKKINN